MVDLPPFGLLERQEIDAWNQWRQENLEYLDLREAFFHKYILNQANLSYAILSGVHFDEASLVDADLCASDFTSASFADAQLMRANLSEAILTQTIFMNADMREANLSEAHLGDTDFSEANLQGAIFREVILQGGSLSGANLSGVDLTGVHFLGTLMEGVNLSGANLSGAFLTGAFISQANLNGANLNGANLSGANLSRANLSGANLSEANLSEVNLSRANLSRANLSGANLSGANLSEANLSRADITGCRVYAISAWNVRLELATQFGLIITPKSEPTVTTDDLEVAQFIYLLLNHKKLRNVLNAVTERGVLLLGRFGGGGLEVLQAVATQLREAQYLPIIFDFDRPQNRNYTETVKTLAGLSRFIIADLSGPSVPQELYATVPHFKIPFVPILEAGRRQFAMAPDLLEYPWVVKPPVIFTSTDELVSLVPSRIIAPAEEKHQARQQLLDELFPS